MSKKKIIASVSIIALLFAAGISVGVFLYGRGESAAVDGSQVQGTTDQDQVSDGNQPTDGIQTGDNNENPTTNPDQGEENTTTPDDGNVDGADDNETVENDNENADNEAANNNNEAAGDDDDDEGNAEVTTDTNVNEVGETTITRVEEQERLVSQAFLDWWKPMAVTLAKSNVNVNLPQITVEKIAITPVAGNDFVYAGQEITYVIDVTNNSDVDVEEIEITDRIPENTTFVSMEDIILENEDAVEGRTVTSENEIVGVKWVVSISAKETISAYFTVKVNEEVTGTISNVAIANGEESKDPTNTPEEGTETKTAIITSNKSSVIKRLVNEDTQEYKEVETAKIGDLITYTIEVTNTGDKEGTTYIKDLIPAGTVFNSADEDAEFDEIANLVIWSVTVPAGETVEKTFTVEVTDISKSIKNTAYIGEISTNEDIVETAGIEVIKTATGVTRTTVDENGEEVIENLSATTLVRPRDVITYTITVTNIGTSTLTDIVVTDELVPNFSETIATLEPGASEDVTVEYEVTQTDVDTQAVITNVATATSGDITDDGTEDTVPTDKTADYTISKTAKLNKSESNNSAEYQAKAEVGDTITYTITVKNIGSITLNDIHVVDTMIGLDETIALAADETKTFTITHVVDNDDIESATENNGALLNVVTATYGDRTEEGGTSTDTRIEYEYTVNFLEKGTDKVLSNPVTKPTTYASVITGADEKITITGYTYDSVDPETLTITTNNAENVINVYYTADAQTYTVNYLEKGTNKVLSQAVTKATTFASVITGADEKITITGYTYDSVDPETLTITTNNAENVINVYYNQICEYTVEYYFNGVLNDKYTISAETLENMPISFNTPATLDGYTYINYIGFDGVVNGSKTTTKGTNIIRVDYGKVVTTIEKAGTPQVKAGGEIEYTITVKNTGYLPATVAVSDELKGTTYVPGSANIGEPTITGTTNQVLTWNNVQVSAATDTTRVQTTTITFRAKTAADSFGTTIKNTANIVGGASSNEVTTTVKEITVKYNEYVEGQKGTDLNIIFILDNSSSMNYPIADQSYTYNNLPIAPTDVSKTRLDNAKTAINNFINGQNNNPNTSMSVITFNKSNTGTETEYRTLMNIDETAIITRTETIENTEKPEKPGKPGKPGDSEDSEDSTETITVTRKYITIDGVEYRITDSKVQGSDGNYYYGVYIPIEYGARLVGTNSVSNSDLKEKVSDISISSEKSGFGTNIVPAFELINDNTSTYISDTKKNIVIVLADGAFNDDYNGDELETLKENVDEIYCIGFGSGTEYDPDALAEISSFEECLPATDAATLLNKFNEILESASGTEQSGTTINGTITFNEATKTIKVSTDCPIVATYDTGAVDANENPVMAELFRCTTTTDLDKYGLTITDGETLTGSIITWDVKEFVKNNPNVTVPDTVYIKYYIPRTTTSTDSSNGTNN